MDVLLPEPFGPSNPVMPLPILNVASLSACTEPYDFESLSAASSGVAVSDGKAHLGVGQLDCGNVSARS